MAGRRQSLGRFPLPLTAPAGPPGPICYRAGHATRGGRPWRAHSICCSAFSLISIFFATFLYLIAFVGNLPWVPRTVDRGHEVVGLAHAGRRRRSRLIALFGLQHSVMARQGFKRAWTRIVPAPVERSIYVLLASLCLIVMFWFWQPIPAVIWSVETPFAVYALWALFGLGWLIVLISTFLISHFELFGLHQVWSHASGHEIPAPVFRTPLLLPARAPSDLCGLRPRFLGDAGDDRRPCSCSPPA